MTLKKAVKKAVERANLSRSCLFRDKMWPGRPAQDWGLAILKEDLAMVLITMFNVMNPAFWNSFNDTRMILDAAVEIAKSLHGGSGGPGGPRRIAGDNRFL